MQKRKKNMIIYIQQRITTAQQPNVNGTHVEQRNDLNTGLKADPAAVEMV